MTCWCNHRKRRQRAAGLGVKETRCHLVVQAQLCPEHPAVALRQQMPGGVVHRRHSSSNGVEVAKRKDVDELSHADG